MSLVKEQMLSGDIAVNDAPEYCWSDGRTTAIKPTPCVKYS